MNKKVKKTLAAGVLATSLLANGANVSAYVPETEIDRTVEDDSTVIARTSADWKKLLEKYSMYDCNLDVQSIYDVVEISEFIRDNYEFETGYSIDTLSQNIIVDEVISYKNPSNPEFSYEEIIREYKALDKTNHEAVTAFLNKYGVYYTDLNAHIEFVLITIMSAIRNDIAWYVKQDVENSDFLKKYNFIGKEYENGSLSTDLSNLTLNYSDTEVNVNIAVPSEYEEYTVKEGDTLDSIVNDYNITHNITDEDLITVEDLRKCRINEDDITVNSVIFIPMKKNGNGFEDIQSVYYNILSEVTYLGKYMTGTLTVEEEPRFLANDTYETNGKTNDFNYGEQEVYEVLSNQNVNDLVREGLRVVTTLSPATTYDYVSLYEQGVDVTALGYGHWFVHNGKGNMIETSYNNETGKEVVNLNETFERPTLSLDLEEEQTYKLVK